MDRIDRTETKYIIIHSSQTPPSKNLDVKDMNKLHRQKGFLNVVHHLIIKRDGSVETGRHLEEVGAHTEGYNDTSVFPRSSSVNAERIHFAGGKYSSSSVTCDIGPDTSAICGSDTLAVRAVIVLGVCDTAPV